MGGRAVNPVVQQPRGERPGPSGWEIASEGVAGNGGIGQCHRRSFATPPRIWRVTLRVRLAWMAATGASLAASLAWGPATHASLERIFTSFGVVGCIWAGAVLATVHLVSPAWRHVVGRPDDTSRETVTAPGMPRRSRWGLAVSWGSTAVGLGAGLLFRQGVLAVFGALFAYWFVLVGMKTTVDVRRLRRAGGRSG